MFTKATSGLAGLLVTASVLFSAATAQPHPWVRSGMYSGSLSIGDADAQADSRIGIRRGDVVESLRWGIGKTATDELYGACHNRGANAARTDVVS